MDHSYLGQENSAPNVIQPITLSLRRILRTWENAYTVMQNKKARTQNWTTAPHNTEETFPENKDGANCEAGR